MSKVGQEHCSREQGHYDVNDREDRAGALARMSNALDELLIDGIRTNTALHKDIIRDAEFQKGGVNIHYLESKLIGHHKMPAK